VIRSRLLGALLDGLSRCDWRVPLVGAWAVFLLFPIWKTGWVNDDIFNSSLPGLYIYRDISPVEDALGEIKGWTFGVGRINPLIHVLKEASHWLLRDLFWYKTTLIAGVLVNLFVFYRLLKRLGASPDLAALCCFLAVTFIQLRIYNDPVYSFYNVMQWLFLGTVLSLGAFHRYLTGGRAGWLALSVLFYLLTALTYEMIYLFWILHIGIFLTTPGRWARAAALTPFVAIAALLTLGSMWLHTLPGYVPTVYAMGLDVRVVGETTLKQIVAAWPGSYAALDPTPGLPVMRGVFSWKTVGAHLIALAFGFTAAAILMVGVVRRGVGEQPRRGGLLILGFLLAVLPAPMIGVAQKYQLELRYGIAHLPVYIETFGVALLFTCGVGFLARRVRPGGVTAKALVGVASLLCAGVAVFHCESNNRVVAALRQPYLTPRREVEEVLDRGRLLEGVPAGATLVVDAFVWDSYEGGNYFYCYHTGTRLKGVFSSREWNAGKAAQLPTQPGSEVGPEVLRVRYAAPETERGWAVAGKLHYLQAAANGGVSGSGISQLRLAVRRGWHMGPDRPFVLHAAYLSPTGAEAPRPVAIGPEEMRRTAVTRNWTVYDVKLPVPYVEGESLWLEFNPPAPVAAQASAALSARSTSP
jgi:hypothetical protein